MDQASPEKELPWITYWLIRVPPEGFGAGLIGFKGLPDQNGVVEVGYGIDPEFRNFGYTTEALGGLIQWAFDDPLLLWSSGNTAFKPGFQQGSGKSWYESLR